HAAHPDPEPSRKRLVAPGNGAVGTGPRQRRGEGVGVGRVGGHRTILVQAVDVEAATDGCQRVAAEAAPTGGQMTTARGYRAVACAVSRSASTRSRSTSGTRAGESRRGTR